MSLCVMLTGNVILKMYEGVSGTLFKKIKEAMMSSFRTKLGALLIKPALKGLVKEFDASEYGGAPMLGLNGLVIKSHGSSKAKDIRMSVLKCVPFVQNDVTGKIKTHILADRTES